MRQYKVKVEITVTVFDSLAIPAEEAADPEDCFSSIMEAAHDLARDEGCHFDYVVVQ